VKKNLRSAVVFILLCLGCFQGCVNPSKESFLTVEETSCIGCGACVKVCKYDAITIIGNKAVIDPSKCQLCGRCVKVCPYDAIH
jgi:Na+-translocating ferredoxin:NAD+ oxidoreductase subunit B